VRIGQPVELRVAKRLDEDYVPPPPGPFAGSGNRLGSPLPAVVTSSTATTTATSAPAAGSSSTAPASFEVDMSAPTTSVQIRLADGTRYA
jgi:UBX domain-containing protein 1